MEQVIDDEVLTPEWLWSRKTEYHVSTSDSETAVNWVRFGWSREGGYCALESNAGRRLEIPIYRRGDVRKLCEVFDVTFALR
jgi:hypothetical protein